MILSYMQTRQRIYKYYLNTQIQNTVHEFVHKRHTPHGVWSSAASKQLYRIMVHSHAYYRTNNQLTNVYTISFCTQKYSVVMYNIFSHRRRKKKEEETHMQTPCKRHDTIGGSDTQVFPTVTHYVNITQCMPRTTTLKRQRSMCMCGEAHQVEKRYNIQH